MELRVKAPLNEQRTHLRFDVTGLSGTVLSAKLRLSPNGSSTSYAVHSVASTSWNEKTITWSTAPPLTATVLATSTVAPDGWTEADVTSTVTTNGTISFGLDTTTLNAVSLSSRETGALAPRLVVVTASTAPVDTAAPIVTLTQPADGSMSRDTSPTFSGVAGTAGGDSSTVTVRLYDGSTASGTPALTRTATRSGSSWSVGAGMVLTAGTYTARAEQTDDAGNIGITGTSTFTVDDVAPIVTLIQPSGGSTSSASSPEFSGALGTAQGDSSTVTLRLYTGTSASGTLVLTRSATGIGSNWSVGAGTALGTGTYTAQAAQDDAAGNTGSSAAVTFTITAATGYRGQVLADAPRTYLRLGESSGTVTSSETGTDAGAYLGGTGLGRPGALSGDPSTSVALDGTSGTVRVPTSANLGPTTTLSLEAWIKPPALPAAAATIIRKDLQYMLRLTTTGSVVFRLWKGGATTEVATPTNTVRPGGWTHVVGTWDGLTMAVYVNGVQLGSGPLVAPIDSGTAALYVGSSAGSYDWMGTVVDEVAVYGAALASTRVQAHYLAADLTPAVTLSEPADGSSIASSNPRFSGMAGTAFGDAQTVSVDVYAGSTASGTPVLTRSTSSTNGAWSVLADTPLAIGTYTAQARQAGQSGVVGTSAPSTFQVTPETSTYRADVEADNPRAYWRLGEVSGTIAASLTGTDAGTYVGGPVLGRTGALVGDTNAAVLLDGVNDVVRAPSSSNLGPTGGLSLEAWIKLPALPTVVASILRKDLQYQLRLSPTGQVSFRLWKNSSVTSLTTPAGAVKAGVWSHVVATWNGSATVVYVNGVQRAAGSLAGPIDTGISSFYIGASSGSYDWLGAEVDEVAVYGTALSAARVTQHYDAAKRPPETPVVRLDTPTASSTMDATPNFGGSAGRTPTDTSTATVKVYGGLSATGSPIRTLTAAVQPSGTFSVKAAPALISGTYTAQVEQDNTAGAVGSSTAMTFTVDAEAPPVMLTAADIAACDTFGDEATAAVLDRLPGTVVSNGDHVYEYATAYDFENCYDPTWGRHKARTKPVLGDHEYLTPGATPYFDYFGAVAGDRTKGYYSYDVGAWHVIATNTNCVQLPGGCGVGSAEEQWLRADLSANRTACTLVYMPAPRFSSGAIHGNDLDMVPFWQALYDYGVEVVVSGDDHVYERFAPQTPSGKADATNGIREFVVGTGGRSHYAFASTTQPNSEVRNNDAFGILKLTLRPGAYDWQFVPEAGKTFADSGSTACR